MPGAPDYSHIESCLDVTDTQIEEALAAAHRLSDPSPRQKTLALLKRMADVATAGAGAPRILTVLAHMACRDWLEGELNVRLIGDDELSVLEVMVDDGLSAQRLLGPLRIDAPYTEFRTVLRERPGVAAPLEVIGQVEARRVELIATPQSRDRSVPPSLAISDSLLPFLSPGRKLPEIISQTPPSEPKAAPPPRPARMPPPLPSRAKQREELVPPLAPPVVADKPETLPPDALLDDEPATQPGQSQAPRRFKPVSLPPHLQQALAPLKKKGSGQ